MRTLFQTVRQFKQDQRGSIAIVFGLSLTMMMLFVGIALDTSRGVSTEKNLGDLLDAAALAGARALTADGASEAEVKKIVAAYVEGYRPRAEKFTYSLDKLTVDVDAQKGQVAVSAEGKLPTIFGKIAGINNFDINKKSAAQFQMHDVELSMVLDVTGSMNGNNKIGGLRDAAKELVEILIDGETKPYKIKIGIAPYSNAVNAGALAGFVKVKPLMTTCVTERKKLNGGFTDDAPTIGNLLGNMSNTCPGSVVLPLTDDKNALITTISGLSASGATAGHIGIGWGWYLVSPKWNGILPSGSAPAPYNDGKTVKVVVLMTDGEFNKEYEKFTNGDSNAQARALCDGIKSDGVQVYTVGFDAPPSALPVLQYCASSSSQFYDAKDDGQLKAAFRQIAEQVTALRLTQ